MIWGIIGKTQTSRPPVALNQGWRRHPFSGAVADNTSIPGGDQDAKC